MGGRGSVSLCWGGWGDNSPSPFSHHSTHVKSRNKKGFTASFSKQTCRRNNPRPIWHKHYCNININFWRRICHTWSRKLWPVQEIPIFTVEAGPSCDIGAWWVASKYAYCFFEVLERPLLIAECFRSIVWNSMAVSESLGGSHHTHLGPLCVPKEWAFHGQLYRHTWPYDGYILAYMTMYSFNIAILWSYTVIYGYVLTILL